MPFPNLNVHLSTDQDISEKNALLNEILVHKKIRFNKMRDRPANGAKGRTGRTGRQDGRYGRADL